MKLISTEFQGDIYHVFSDDAANRFREEYICALPRMNYNLVIVGGGPAGLTAGLCGDHQDGGFCGNALREVACCGSSEAEPSPSWRLPSQLHPGFKEDYQPAKSFPPLSRRSERGIRGQKQ
jgi:hypothetical protein